MRSFANAGISTQDADGQTGPGVQRTVAALVVVPSRVETEQNQLIFASGAPWPEPYESPIATRDA
jgi:hypothetical protein